MSKGRPATIAIDVQTDGPVAVGRPRRRRCGSPPSSAAGVAVPLSAHAAGIGNVAVARQRAGQFRARAQLHAGRQAGDADPRRAAPCGRSRRAKASRSRTTCSPISCRAPARVAVSVGPSTALDAAALLKALDRYPFGCSEQITSRALPLLYVNELASEAHLALDTAVDQRIRDAIERLLARQGSNGSFGLWSAGGDDVWLDAYVTDFLTRARERGFAVPDVALQARARPAAQLRQPTRAIRARTAGASSPMRSTCWRATAPRRSATCATSPTPSSTTSRRRSPRRRSPPRSACSATGPAPSASMRRRSTRSRRRRRSSSAAPTTARRCATPPRW